MPTRSASRQASAAGPQRLPCQQQSLVREAASYRTTKRRASACREAPHMEDFTGLDEPEVAGWEGHHSDRSAFA